MRRLFWTWLMVIAICVGFQGKVLAEEKGTVSPGGVMKQAEQALDTAKDYTLQEKQEYQKKLESQLADVSKGIDELKRKAKTATQSVTAKLDATMAELKKKQEALEKKMPELRTATSKAWGEVKDGVDKALEELKKAYESARSHFE